MSRLVIPDPDAFGVRVTTQTPLAHVVAVLRRANPRATFGELKVAANELMSGRWPAVEVSGERAPIRFDSGADPTAVPSASVDDDARAVGSEVAAVEEGGSAPTNIDTAPAVDPEQQLAEWQPERNDVAAWVAKQRGLAKGLTMNKSGRIPARVLTAYRQAHRAEILASLVPVAGGGEPMPAEPLDP